MEKNNQHSASDNQPRRAVVLLPTYNEKENLENIVAAILAAAPVDIWILDDNSPDGTGAIADRLVEEHAPRVRVEHRAEKQGLGPAYIAGFKLALAAGYERILEMDADFSHPPEKLQALLENAETYDLVLGSRWVPGGGTENWPAHRQFISKAGSFYARTLLGVGIKDITGGFKCFRREVLEALDLENIVSAGYMFQIEVTYQALQKGFSVHETPITFVERRIGKSKMSRSIVLEAIIKVPILRLTGKK